MSAAPFAASPEVARHVWAQLGISILAGLREIWAHKFRSVLVTGRVLVYSDSDLLTAYA